MLWNGHTHTYVCVCIITSLSYYISSIDIYLLGMLSHLHNTKISKSKGCARMRWNFCLQISSWMQNTCRNIPVMTLLNTMNCFLDFSFVCYVHVAPGSQTFRWLLKFSVLHSMGIFQVLTLTKQYFSQLFYNFFYLLTFDLGGWYFLFEHGLQRVFFLPWLYSIYNCLFHFWSLLRLTLHDNFIIILLSQDKLF